MWRRMASESDPDGDLVARVAGVAVDGEPAAEVLGPSRSGCCSRVRGSLRVPDVSDRSGATRSPSLSPSRPRPCRRLRPCVLVVSAGSWRNRRYPARLVVGVGVVEREGSSGASSAESGRAAARRPSSWPLRLAAALRLGVGTEVAAARRRRRAGDRTDAAVRRTTPAGAARSRRAADPRSPPGRGGPPGPRSSRARASLTASGRPLNTCPLNF